jgi:hypothetical protein
MRPPLALIREQTAEITLIIKDCLPVKKREEVSMMKGVGTHMTTTTVQSTMIAIFADRDQANQAIDNLRHAGYSYNQIRLVEQGTNSFIEDLKSLFKGQGATSTNSADDWMRIGVPEQDAHNYQRELDAGRSIVLIKAFDNPEQALSIMRQSGAYDLTFRQRSMQPTTVQGAYNPNVPPGTPNPNAQPGAYNPNVPPGAPNPDAQPRTYDRQTQPRRAKVEGE